MKLCSRCKQIKPFSDYYGTAAKPSSYCKPCASARSTEWHLSNREKKADINRAWRQRNADRRKISSAASVKVFKAIRSGKLVRPSCCSQCGSMKAIEAAHENYDKPLEVIWLCRRCHRTWDAAKPKTCP